MAGGQVLDLQAEASSSNSFTELQKIHALKTGALLKFCFEVPTKVLTKDEQLIQTMSKVGHNFGLLFQIIDDILDETASFEDLGKSPGKDLEQKKLTYVSFFGMEKALKEAENHYNEGISLLKSLNKNTTYLESLFKLTHDKGIDNATNK